MHAKRLCFLFLSCDRGWVDRLIALMMRESSRKLPVEEKGEESAHRIVVAMQTFLIPSSNTTATATLYCFFDLFFTVPAVTTQYRCHLWHTAHRRVST